MIYLILGLSALFFLIGIILTEKNSKYLLSGYNIMSDEERSRFNIEGYIQFYRRFHFILAGSFLIIGLFLYIFIDESFAGIFAGVFPILAYIFFIIKSLQFSKGINTKGNKIAVVVMVITLFIVIGLIFLGYKNSSLIVRNNELKIEGIYGEELEAKDILEITLVNELPQITSKTNGYAMGKVNKGYFQTKEGKVVKLILNDKQSPYIKIIKKNGKVIYYSSNTTSNKTLFKKIETQMPTLVKK